MDMVDSQLVSSQDIRPLVHKRYSPRMQGMDPQQAKVFLRDIRVFTFWTFMKGFLAS